jgi:hypothetical protein
MFLDGATIEMTGNKRFNMTIPQTVSFNNVEAQFNMIVEFKIVRGKLKMILKDVQER